LRVVDFIVVFAVDLGVLVEVDLGVLLEVDLYVLFGVDFGVVDVLQVVGNGHFHPTHFEVVVLTLELDFELDDGGGVGVDDGGAEDVNSGGAHGSVLSRFFAT
jgi:hypothetical protein